MWAQDYDERGEYIKTWVPELAQIPAPSVFEPWRLSREDQQKYGVQIGVRGLSCWSRMLSGDLLYSHMVLMFEAFAVLQSSHVRSANLSMCPADLWAAA